MDVVYVNRDCVLWKVVFITFQKSEVLTLKIEEVSLYESGILF